MPAAAAVVIVALSVLILRATVLDTVTVSSDSMAATVCAGDTVLLTRKVNPDTVHVGDIVTFASPQSDAPTIKRVVAVAGQSVAIRDSYLVVDGHVREEPYVDHASIDGVYFGPVTVSDGSVFVMGDHRETSVDSRAYGPIPASSISGRMLWSLWPTCQG
jgi:signal peptidase I